MKRNNIILLLKILFSIAILCLAAYIINPRQILVYCKKVDLQSIIISFVFIVASLFSSAFRWYYLIRWQSKDIQLGVTVKIALWGILLNSFIPGNLGNDIYRFKSFPSGRSGKTAVLSLLVQERFIGLGAFLFSFILCFAAGYWSIQTSWEILFILFWSVLGLTVLVAVYWKSKSICNFIVSKCNNAKLKKFCLIITATTMPLGSRDGKLVILLTLCGFFLFSASLFILSVGMHSSADFNVICMGVVVVEIVRFLPITVQGIGVREGIMAWFFFLSGLPSGEGFAVAALGYALLSLGQLGVGGISLLLPPHRQTNNNASEKDDAN